MPVAVNCTIPPWASALAGLIVTDCRVRLAEDPQANVIAAARTSKNRKS
jgi:hypothetical protein